MSTLTITNEFAPNQVAFSALINQNNAEIQTWANGGIDDSNLNHAVGIYASSILPTTGPQATFGGGTIGYTFPGELTITGLINGAAGLTIAGVFMSNVAVASTVIAFANSVGNTQIFAGGSTVATVAPTLLNIGDSAAGAMFAMSRSGNLGIQAGFYANNEVVAGAQTAGTPTAGDVWGSRSTTTGRLNTGGASGNYSFDGGIVSAGNISLLKGGVSIATINGTTGVYTASDARLKEDIAPLERGLAMISALKPSTFRWKDGSGSGVGFIAQDVRTVLQQAVMVMDDETGKLGVSQAVLMPYVVRALQEIQAWMAEHP
jgi:hypothetical protein